MWSPPFWASPPRAGRSVADSIVEALSGRRLLMVLDNCEHVLDAAAELVETILARTATVKVVATSREGLRVGAEQLWPVPSLPVLGRRRRRRSSCSSSGPGRSTPGSRSTTRPMSRRWR